MTDPTPPRMCRVTSEDDRGRKVTLTIGDNNPGLLERLVSDAAKQAKPPRLSIEWRDAP